MCPIQNGLCTYYSGIFTVFEGSNPRSPGTHIVGPWATDHIKLYRGLRTGTQYISNWASRVMLLYIGPAD